MGKKSPTDGGERMCQQQQHIRSAAGFQLARDGRVPAVKDRLWLPLVANRETARVDPEREGMSRRSMPAWVDSEGSRGQARAVGRSSRRASQ